MKKQLHIILICYFLIHSIAYANSNPPKREFRAAWIATVTNLDWPSSPYLSPEQQRLELIGILDKLFTIGINTVVFQIRPECDAFYLSSLEPWSYYLTGSQGRTPSPHYDPLEFAVTEAHKRGMELHAWFNPYRAVKQVGAYSIDQNHVTIKHPDWIIQIGNFKFLNPGLPMVREYVTSIIMDVVTRYDIDGVHFDDYFYPYPPNQITNQDNQTFASYSRGFTNQGDWRRDNVNLLIKMVYEGIQSVKPYVKFGISPFGIWKNGIPTGISGLDSYSSIYCDAVAWLNQKIVDYLTPQLYWPFGGGQDYGKLMPWWASKINGRHLYPGQAAYRIDSWSSSSEMPNQLRLNRVTDSVYGSVFFRASSLVSNPRGFADSLKTDFYRYPALSPIMSWKDVIPPNIPGNLRYEPLHAKGPANLIWDAPLSAVDGDTAFRYVIYRFDRNNIQNSDLDDPANILSIEGLPYSTPEIPPNIEGPYYYTVTALDRNSNESNFSDLISVYPPRTPVLASPVDGEPSQTEKILLTWLHLPAASSYHLQVSVDSLFGRDLAWDEIGICDTFKIITGLDGMQRYFWRVNSSSAGGTSNFSSPFSFITGFPTAPLLVYPTNNTPEIPTNPIFSWTGVNSAISYRIQVSKSINFASSSVVVDSIGIEDTTFTGIELNYNRFYFWRVNAMNQFGTGNWSEIFKFKTVISSVVAENEELPDEYKLYSNYPNPFNPTTTIPYYLMRSGLVELKIFNLLGEEIVTLVHEFQNAGYQEVFFDASSLASGIYYYRLATNGRVLIKKMLLIK